MRTCRLARSMPSSIQILLLNVFGIALGFYLLMPFLATYLRDQLHLAAAIVGAVLGLRVLCQQGLTLIGGTAADRFGARPVIITGCALRVVAFGMFAVFDDVTGLVTASILVGLAGALFSPAARAYTAVEAGDRRLDAFALYHVASTAGALTGPLLGGFLVGVNFRVSAAVAAAVFAVLTVWQLFALPAREVEKPRESPFASWRSALADRGFVAFAAATSVGFLLYNQFYLLLPLEASRVTGWAGATGGIFLISTVLTLLTQIRLVSWCSRRFGPGRSIAIGLVVAASAFVPMALSSSFVADVRPGGGSLGQVALAALPVAVATVLLTIGLDITQPFSQDLVSEFARPGLTGTYLAIAMTASGVSTAGGTTVVGYLDDLGRGVGLPWASSAALALIAATAAGVVVLLYRTGRLSRKAVTSAA